MPKFAASAVAPPGLEDKSAPAKVQINPPTLPYVAGALPPVQELLNAGSRNAVPRANGLGEWVNAVMATAPYLDAQGLQQALGILDCAINNVHQVKALEGIIATSLLTQADGPYPSSHHHLFAAELMRLQVCEQQQRLLLQLHQLRATNGLKTRSMASVPTMPTGSPLDPAALFAAAAALQLPAQSLAGLQQMGLLSASQMRCSSERTAELVLGALGATLEVPRQPMQTNSPATAQMLNQQSSADKAAKGPVRQVETLSTSLQLLSSEDPDCLFIVRRINKLGFKAARKLKQHFAFFGQVVRVLVAHSTVRTHGDPQCHARRRPSSLGFVHMASPKAVREILALGAEQEVDGSVIRVQRFERQHVEEASLEEEVGDTKEMHLAEWDRQQSAHSSASTAASTSAISAISLGSLISDTYPDQEWR